MRVRGEIDEETGASVRPRPRRGAFALGAAIVLVATTLSTGTAGAAGDARLRAAERATARAFDGTYRPIDATPRPAASGKRIAIISAGQASVSAQVPTDGAAEAAEAIGWDAEVYDGRLVPATYPGLVRQAIAADADAILLVAIDCQAVKQPLVEAREAGIVVVGIGAFDCDDPQGGGDRRGLFTTQLDFGPRGEDLGKLVASYGTDQANYIIAASDNTAKIILVSDPEFTTLHYTDRGFRRAIKRSRGAEIVDTVEITTADFTNNQLVPKIQAALQRNPDADWIKSPYTYATTLGVVPALGARAGTVDVMGGEGYEAELDLLRDGRITAVNIFSADWEGWAAVDTINSAFRGTDPVDSGVGWVLADRTHNVPASGGYEPPVDYRAEFREAWGVT